MSVILLVSCCLDEQIELKTGKYYYNDSYIIIDQNKNITIQIANNNEETYFYPYEYELIEKDNDSQCAFKIVLHNKISSKMAYYEDEFILYFLPMKEAILLKKTKEPFRILPINDEVIFRKKQNDPI